MENDKQTLDTAIRESLVEAVEAAPKGIAWMWDGSDSPDELMNRLDQVKKSD